MTFEDIAAGLEQYAPEDVYGAMQGLNPARDITYGGGHNINVSNPLTGQTIVSGPLLRPQQALYDNMPAYRTALDTLVAPALSRLAAPARTQPTPSPTTPALVKSAGNYSMPNTYADITNRVPTVNNTLKPLVSPPIRKDLDGEEFIYPVDDGIDTGQPVDSGGKPPKDGDEIITDPVNNNPIVGQNPPTNPPTNADQGIVVNPIGQQPIVDQNPVIKDPITNVIVDSGKTGPDVRDFIAFKPPPPDNRDDAPFPSTDTGRSQPRGDVVVKTEADPRQKVISGTPFTGLQKTQELQQKTIENDPATDHLDNEQKEELSNIVAEGRKLLGWADSGEWGYARTRNLLTGGGLGAVEDEGPEVAWTRLGQPAPSTNYISNIDGRDYMPSRLAPNERLGNPTGEPLTATDFTPENRRAGSDVPVTVGSSGSAHEGGEGRSIVTDALTHADLAGRGLTDSHSLNKQLTDIEIQNTVHNFRNNIKPNDFAGAKDAHTASEVFAEKFGLEGDDKKSFINSFSNTLKTFTEGVSDVGEWLTTPFIKTEQLGIAPLDVLTIVAAGPAIGLGMVVQNKITDALLETVGLKDVVGQGINGLKNLFSGKNSQGYVIDNTGPAVRAMQEHFAAYGGNVHGAIHNGDYIASNGTTLATGMWDIAIDPTAAGSGDIFGRELISIVDTAFPGKDYKVGYNRVTGEVFGIDANGTNHPTGTTVVYSEGEGKTFKGKTSSNAKGRGSKFHNIEIRVVDNAIGWIGGGRDDKSDDKGDDNSGGGKGGSSIIDWIKDKIKPKPKEKKE